MGKIKFILIFLVVSIGISFKTAAENQRLVINKTGQKISQKKTGASSEKKLVLKTIKGFVSHIVSQVGEETEIYFTLKGREERFMVDMRQVYLATYITMGCEVEISFYESKKDWTRIETFDLAGRIEE